MPLFQVRQRSVWFAHVPKTGGTSVEQALASTADVSITFLDWGWHNRFRRGVWPTRRPPCSPQHLTWADGLAAQASRPDHVVGIVRDPAQRIQSEWRYQKSRQSSTKLGRAFASLPFSIWLPIVLSMAARNPYAFDNHIRPQSDFLPETATVFRLEDGLDGVLHWMSDALETPLPPAGSALKTGKSHTMSEQDAALIYGAFQKDFQRFGYSPLRVSARKPAIWAHIVARPLVWLDLRGLI